MPYVHEYIILTGNHEYKSEGTSHADAMNRFVSDPPITMGFHSGNYDAAPMEAFYVFGPDPKDKEKNTLVRLVAHKREVTYFLSQDEIVRQELVKEKVVTVLSDLTTLDKIRLHAIDNSSPKHDLTSRADQVAALTEGVRINDMLVPWSAVTGIEKIAPGDS